MIAIFYNIFSFLLIISIIVFVHELGHYLLARLCNVKVESFSIGFGKELCGFSDKRGTRWRFSMIPFGGYVKMLGEQSLKDAAKAKPSDDELQYGFIHKTPWQRIAIAAAGPIFNIILAILLFSSLIFMNGAPNKPSSIIAGVVPHGAADKAGLVSGDKITQIADKKIHDFSDISIALYGLQADNKVTIKVERDGKLLNLIVAPELTETQDPLGNKIKIAMIGVKSSSTSYSNVGAGRSLVLGTELCYKLTREILVAAGKLVTGRGNLQDMGGPIKIANYSGQSLNLGLSATIWFIALISLNLGIMNLLPIPLLDGGHIALAFIEILRGGKPLPERMQIIVSGAGMTILASLMIFTTINDIIQSLI